VFRAAELVAVIETVFDPERPTIAWIPALATKPNLRGQRIASAVLKRTLSLHHERSIVQHEAFISADNVAGRRCAERVGFVAVTLEPDKHGFLKFEHNKEQ
jgi:GNAT superfamily N-acetyltransferase